MRKRFEVQLETKRGDLLEGILIEEFNQYFLIVDFISCVQHIQLTEYSFNAEFNETYIDLLNRTVV